MCSARYQVVRTESLEPSVAGGRPGGLPGGLYGRAAGQAGWAGQPTGRAAYRRGWVGGRATGRATGRAARAAFRAGRVTYRVGGPEAGQGRLRTGRAAYGRAGRVADRPRCQRLPAWQTCLADARFGHTLLVFFGRRSELN